MSDLNDHLISQTPENDAEQERAADKTSPSTDLLAELQEELRKVTNAHIQTSILLAQMTLLCRDVKAWLYDGPMTDLDKRITFGDRLDDILIQANVQCVGHGTPCTDDTVVGTPNRKEEK